MKRLVRASSRKSRFATYCSSLVLVAAAAIGTASSAKAYTFNTSPDWDVELDTNLAYTIGVRADKRDGKISNNPIQQNDEYKFPNVGNLTTNRVDAASELSVVYQQNTGVDVSVDAWKDFAYNGGTQNNPGTYAPGVPYSALSSSPNGHYGAYTNNFYNVGAELENAFVFRNFNVGSIPVSVKVGRFTEYWGNALFSGFQAISYGQSPIDIIKAVGAPGTEVKDLFLPRGQASLHAQISQTLSLGFQYQFEYRYNRFPEGGTFLGIADAFFKGPETLEGTLHRGHDDEPANLNGNFGVEALWSPNFVNGTLGFYFRQFDDPSAYSPFEINETNGTYHLGYARHVHLYGLSLDRNLGTIATAFEASIRTNTGLLSVPGGNATLGNDPVGNDGARGNTFNFVGNAILPLTPTRVWQTGQLVGEIAWTRLMAVTHDKGLYDGEGYACSRSGIASGGERDGCATTDEVNMNIVFDPQWLQVYPGIDVDTPISVNYGLHGNGQTLALAGTGDEAGSIAYSAGIHALIRQKYNVKLVYNGFNSPTGKIARTPSGAAYYSTGSGNYMWNDKAQVLLVLSTAF